MSPFLLSESVVEDYRNKDWTSYRKLWSNYKIKRNKRMKEKDTAKKSELYAEERDIAKKIVKIAKTLKDGKGKPITVPVFPYLGAEQ